MKKKLFISVPMKHRTEENIKKSIEKMHKIAEVVFDQELDVIPSYIEHTPPADNNQAVWYLGKSIMKLAEADYFVGVQYCEIWKGCDIESHVARSYGITSTYVEIHDIMPDCVEIIKTHFPHVGNEVYI